MLRRAFALLACTLALAACAAGGARPRPIAYTGAPPTAGTAPLQTPAPAGRGVAILLPLTGPNAGLGEALLNAAKLALEVPGAPRLTPIDTAGTAEGAAAAAQTAIAGGAGMILGPLTSAETAAAGPVAAAAGVPVLAFTNDSSQAKPGVWTLGITPLQQVRPVAAYAQSQGRSRLGALVPDNSFGHAMSDALVQAAAALGEASPVVTSYSGGMSGINSAARIVADYANRRGPLDAQIKAARSSGTGEGRKQAAEIAKRGVPPAPFDALLVTASGDELAEIVSLLSYYDVDAPAVRLLGPTTWAANAESISRQRGTSGALFAAPDPAFRGGFESKYSEKFGAGPPRVSGVAYDAATIALTLAQGPGFSGAALTRGEGFPGVDGPLVLQGDGSVRRGLAVFELHPGGAQIVQPAQPPTGT